MSASPHPPNPSPPLAGTPHSTHAGSPADDPQWRAILTRDPRAAFFYGVITTGIFCRPSCPSRRPLRRNTSVFPTPAAAEHAGLRPCLRCRPLASPHDPAALYVRTVVRLLTEHVDNRAVDTAPPRLAELAAHTGLSPFHLQRTFRRLTGLTPKQYHQHLRQTALRNALRPEPGARTTARDITTAALAAGFTSASQIYADPGLGMRPTHFRAGAPHLDITYVAAPSPLGRMLLAATDRGLCFLHFGEVDTQLLIALRTEFPHARLFPASEPYTPDLQAWLTALDHHLHHTGPTLDCALNSNPGGLPLGIRATAFQARVWNYLRQIPPGETRTYTAVAHAIGQPTAVRAVASACARNNVALAIPCHRVLRASGHLGGYRWGLPRKQALLAQESQIQQSESRQTSPNTTQHRHEDDSARSGENAGGKLSPSARA